MEDDAEMTIEANPAAVSSSDLQHLRRIGFNRLSIGVQSFDDSLLEFLGRVHKGSHAETLISDAQKAGFECIGLDLMYGIPGQTLEGWKDDLRSAADLGVKHVSCYALTVEEGTPYGHSIQIGDSPAPDERLTVELYQTAHEFLTGGGYEHYEVSNYSLGRKWRSRHNTAYWSGRPYLGFGPSAHSFDGVARRSWNTSSLNDYLARMEAGKLPEAGSEVLNENQKLLERIMLGLRTSDGVDMEQVSGRGALPEAIRNMLSNWVSHGLCALEGERIRPSARGMLMADGMASSLAAVLDL
jgi:oxygen-independent coproporphyrinogen-3 oxidase